MMRLTGSSATLAALVGVALAVPVSAQLIPADWKVRHHYTLGDAVGGIVGNPAAATAIDSVGGMDLLLPETGTPLSTAGMETPVAVDFNNAYGPWPTVATEYYSDPNADFNPIDPQNWGVSFDIFMNEFPAGGDDVETGLVHLGTGFYHGSPGLILQLEYSQYVVHMPAAAYQHTGLYASNGGWDHVEFANIDGVMDLAVNGVAAGLAIDANVICAEGDTCPLDPDPGVMIGAVFMDGQYGVPTAARGVDAVIDEVKIYDGGEIPCDFDSDWGCNVNDINLMFMQGDLVAGVADPDGTSQFNLSGDTSIDGQDISLWLELAAENNGYGTAPYLRGDTDHLGNISPAQRTVDITDFNALASNYAPQGTPSGIFAKNWHLGNFDGDADVDITDFNFLAGNYDTNGYAAGQAGAAPEPTAALLLTIGGLFMVAAASKRWPCQ